MFGKTNKKTTIQEKFVHVSGYTEGHAGSNGYSVSGDMVTINVDVKSTITANNDLNLWTMPVGLRPAVMQTGAVYSNGSIYQVHVDTDGLIQLYGTVAQTSKTFYGQVSYVAEN